ncbi:MAG: PEP-CTERM sorting domain-containing protein [Candidatus Competibacteraceae bacterium]|nr:PEP-CTERM sorting domain-containing protein [Candidatus Competibacteraceae bacterium]
MPGLLPGTYTLLQWTGTLTQNPSGTLGFDPSVNTSIWSYNLDTVNKVLTVTVVPEPATLSLLGVYGLTLLRRRR